MMINVDKFVASVMKCLWNPHREDAYMCRHWINKALDAQGLKFENGEIVKSQRTIVAEAKEAIFDNEDEKIRKIIKDSLQFYFDGRLSEGTNDTDYAMCITWLEKQGEQKPVGINASLINKMVNDYKNTDEYVEGDYKGKPINCMVRAYRQGIKDILSISKEDSIKPTWSEEDEDMAGGIRDALKGTRYNYYYKDSIEMIDWLKSIKQRLGGK